MKQENIYNKQTELSNCTFVKTVLMILVVVYHSILFWGGNWFTGDPVNRSRFMTNVAEWLNSFHIYAFTLVSGYIFYYIKYEKGKYKEFLPFVKTKALRLLIPYVFISVVWAIPFNCIFYKSNVSTVFKNFALAVNPAQLWFLWMLFDVFVIFWIFSDFFKMHTILGIVAILFAYGVGFIIGYTVENIFMLWRALTYLPLFFVGFKIRQYGSGILRKIPSICYLAIHIGAFIVNKYVSEQEHIIFNLAGKVLSFCLSIIGAIAAFVILQKIADFVNYKENKLINAFTKYSMPIYLLHQQIIYISIYLLNGRINIHLNAIVNFVAAIVLSLLLSSILMKFRFTKFLVGEK